MRRQLRAQSLIIHRMISYGSEPHGVVFTRSIHLQSNRKRGMGMNDIRGAKAATIQVSTPSSTAKIILGYTDYIGLNRRIFQKRRA